MTAQGDTVISNDVVIIGGAIGSILLAVITAFFALRKTVIESTSAENQSFFIGLSNRLKEVEDDLTVERNETQKLRGEVIDLREQLSSARMNVSEIERRNSVLENERNCLSEERVSLRKEIRDLEERLRILERTSENSEAF